MVNGVSLYVRGGGLERRLFVVPVLRWSLALWSLCALLPGLWSMVRVLRSAITTAVKRYLVNSDFGAELLQAFFIRPLPQSQRAEYRDWGALS